jgi:hypothetical protein
MERIREFVKSEISKTTTRRSNESITESIKNLGILAKRIQENGDFTFPADLNVTGDLKVFGNAVAVPIGTMIMWTKDTPPPPNTAKTNFMTTNYEDDGDICWYPCVGGPNRNGIKIPDMRGKMIVCQGNTAGSSYYHHHFSTLLGNVGGNVPVRDHSHSGTVKAQPGHYFDDMNYTTWAKGDQGTATDLTMVVSTISNAGNFHHNYWGKDIIPHSVIVQFWIRIR